MQQEGMSSKMSSTGAGSWSVFADTVRQGVDTFAATQKMFLDGAAYQNTILMGFVQQSLGNGVTPEIIDLAGRTTQTFLQSQTMMLDLAVEQTQLGIGLLKGMAANSAGSLNTEFWDMLEKGAITFAAAQKRLLEYAGQQADAMVKAGREGNSATPNPLAQMAGLARQAAQALAPKEYLDAIAKATERAVAAMEQEKQRLSKEQAPVDPAQHFLRRARETFQNYMALQLKLTEQAARLMADWTRAFETGSTWQPSVTFEDLARQGVEAFYKTQSEIQGFAFRSSGANWS
jgi:hypothetical protein